VCDSNGAGFPHQVEKRYDIAPAFLNLEAPHESSHRNRLPKVSGIENPHIIVMAWHPIGNRRLIARLAVGTVDRGERFAKPLKILRNGISLIIFSCSGKINYGLDPEAG